MSVSVSIPDPAAALWKHQGIKLAGVHVTYIKHCTQYYAHQEDPSTPPFSGELHSLIYLFHFSTRKLLTGRVHLSRPAVEAIMWIHRCAVTSSGTYPYSAVTGDLIIVGIVGAGRQHYRHPYYRDTCNTFNGLFCGSRHDGRKCFADAYTVHRLMTQGFGHDDGINETWRDREHANVDGCVCLHC